MKNQLDGSFFFNLNEPWGNIEDLISIKEKMNLALKQYFYIEMFVSLTVYSLIINRFFKACNNTKKNWKRFYRQFISIGYLQMAYIKIQNHDASV